MLDPTKNLCHQMRLFGIHASCERRAKEAVAHQLHPLEFLRLVLEDELLSRKDRSSKMLITKARLSMAEQKCTRWRLKSVPVGLIKKRLMFKASG